MAKPITNDKYKERDLLAAEKTGEGFIDITNKIRKPRAKASK